MKIEICLYRKKFPNHSLLFLLLYYPGLRATILIRFSQWLYKNKISFLAYFIVTINDFLHGVWVGPRARIGEGLFLGHPRGLVINPEAKIGKYCSVVQQVDIGGPCTIIGNYVNFGAGAKVISTNERPVTVGDFVYIGAGAIVTKDVPDFSVVVGVPAKVIRKMSDTEIQDHWKDQINCSKENIKPSNIKKG